MAARGIVLGSLDALSRFTMFVLPPTLGRGPAHEHFLTEFLALTGLGGLVFGEFFLVANLFVGWFL